MPHLDWKFDYFVVVETLQDSIWSHRPLIPPFTEDYITLLFTRLEESGASEHAWYEEESKKAPLQERGEEEKNAALAPEDNSRGLRRRPAPARAPTNLRPTRSGRISGVRRDTARPDEAPDQPPLPEWDRSASDDSDYSEGSRKRRRPGSARETRATARPRRRPVTRRTAAEGIQQRESEGGSESEEEESGAGSRSESSGSEGDNGVDASDWEEERRRRPRRSPTKRSGGLSRKQR